MDKTKRLLTGDRPTGPLHIGHYFGSLKNRVKLQDEGYETFIIIADYQVITDRLDTSAIEENIYNLVADYISVGLDPKRSTFFVQSKVPQLPELMQIFSMLVTTSRVSRNPTVKEEVKSMGLEGKMSLGMFSYPVSQAADILLFRANSVPVGEDQLPHIEVTKEIARKFNNTYGEVFPIPEPMLSNATRLLGLDGDQKMSKSRGNAIFLSDDADTIREKIKKAKTDSGAEIKYNKEEKPYLSGLLEIYKLVSDIEIKDIEAKFAGKGYKEFKEDLAKEIIKFLEPIQKKRSEVTKEQITQILREGNQRATEVGRETLDMVKEAMKMTYCF
jgi:tryptophanyl-tRNA synthetase